MEAILGYWTSYVTALIGLIWLCVIACVARWYGNRRSLSRRARVWLEITPTTTVSKTPAATEQLFSVIHGLRTSRSFIDKLLGREPLLCFEIVSTRSEGIRFLALVDERDALSLQKSIAAYIPDAKVQQIERIPGMPDTVMDFKATSHYALPLAVTSTLEGHDPLSYITAAMANLLASEEVTLQLVVQPVRLKQATVLARRIMTNEKVFNQLKGGKFTALERLAALITLGLNGISNLISEIYMGSTYGHQNTQAAKRAIAQKPAETAKPPTQFELELLQAMHHKLTQPLFQVNLRLAIQSQAAHEHLKALRSALDSYSVPPYQSLKPRLPVPLLAKTRIKLAQQRLPSLTKRGALILSAAEVAGLYHFPSSKISKTDNLVASLSRTLPAPVSLKAGNDLSVLLGENHHHGVVTPIGLTEAERERHVYIVGGTGNGKTTMLQYAIVQDIQAGKGVAVIDPHGDLAETLLSYIPEERIRDVIYMNPDDLAYPIGMNLLELPEGLSGDELLREKDLVTESTISVLRKIFSDDDSGGHRIEYILRNTIQTALTLEAPTLFTIFELLNDPKFRRSVVKTLEDDNLRSFWRHELGKAGDYQRVKMVAGITAKIGRFLFSGATKRVLEQPKSTIDFDDILDSGKILICNFSKGLLGEDTSALFGTTVLAKLQLASLRRARTPSSSRRPYYLYVDEFQNFATMSFVQMLSEARKYKLFLTMAEQSTAQQDQQRLVEIMLANVGTVVCFRSGSPADERLLLPLFQPHISEGEISNLPAYSYYVRINAVEAQEPMSGVTVLLGNAGSTEIADKVISSSRAHYAATNSLINQILTQNIRVSVGHKKRVVKRHAIKDRRPQSADARSITNAIPTD